MGSRVCVIGAALAAATGCRIGFNEQSLEGLDGAAIDAAASDGQADAAIDAPVAGCVAQLAVGRSHVCVRRTDGTTWCWGLNLHGQLGVGDLVNKGAPTLVTAVGTLIDVQPGGFHTCGRLTSGQITCFGANYQGQLGEGTTMSGVPPSLPALSASTALVVGDEYSCVITTGQTLSCWGRNNNGQIGDGTTMQRTTPVPGAMGLTGIVAARLGIWTTCAQTTTGPYCWGDNAWGQIGNGTTMPSLTPTAVVGLTGTPAELIVRNEFTAARMLDGSIEAWATTPTRSSATGPTTRDRRQRP